MEIFFLLLGVSRLVGAVALGWRSGARPRCCFLPLFSPCACTCALLWMFILTHATAQPFHSKQSYPLHHLQHVKKGLTLYQTRSNAIILQETLPAYCFAKVVRMKTGEVVYEKEYMSPRPPPKIWLKHEWKRELGSEHAQRPEVGQLSRSFQSNQPTLNPIRERTGETPLVKMTREPCKMEDRC